MKNEYSTIRFENLTARLFKRNILRYTYKSPGNYTRQAYKFNQIIYIYIDGRDSYIDTHSLKNATRKEIAEYLKTFKATSRRYSKSLTP